MERGKVAVFAFIGETGCFMHALLNTLDLADRGYEVALVIEGSATKLVPQLREGDTPIGRLFAKVMGAGLLDCVCQACAHQMGTLEEAKDQGLELCSEMSGHPAMGRYMDEGYTVVTF